jgi:hypothetical protein
MGRIGSITVYAHPQRRYALYQMVAELPENVIDSSGNALNRQR